MENKILDELILEVLPCVKQTPIATYVVANKVNQLLHERECNNRTNTNIARTRLKKLEKSKLAKTVPTSYKSILSWVKIA